MIRTQAGTYEVMEENRDGWNPEAFKERYSDILDKYDYIVGDWGYGQLRLRGFYTDLNRKVPFEQRISALDEYLHEFCNFGCPYFVLRKVKAFLGPEDSQSGQDDAGMDVIIDLRQDHSRDENAQPYGERKERRRFQPRQNKQERTERNNGTPGRNDRHDKPKFAKEKPDKNGREQGKDRRSNQLRPNRERDKVPTGSNPPKRES